jgi:hypothetical protein
VCLVSRGLPLAVENVTNVVFLDMVLRTVKLYCIAYTVGRTLIFQGIASCPLNQSQWQLS